VVVRRNIGHGLWLVDTVAANVDGWEDGIMIVEPRGASGFAGMTESVAQLVAASKVGFTVSDAGGQPILNAIDALHTKFLKHLANATALSRRLPLGSSPAALVYEPFLTTIATDPHECLIPALQQLQKDLEDARGAIQVSVASYQQTEQGTASNVRGLGTWT
jgi:hypothetical protein